MWGLNEISMACNRFAVKLRCCDFPTDGQVYTWGQNSRGQLGLGRRKSGITSPQHVQCLSSMPLVQVSAGGQQSFALSVSGGVFGWGRNDCGQLGLGDTEGPVTSFLFENASKEHWKCAIWIASWLNLLLSTDRNAPTSVHILNLKRSSYVSCGKEHTAVLTKVSQ